MNTEHIRHYWSMFPGNYVDMKNGDMIVKQKNERYHGTKITWREGLIPVIWELIKRLQSQLDSSIRVEVFVNTSVARLLETSVLSMTGDNNGSCIGNFGIFQLFHDENIRQDIAKVVVSSATKSIVGDVKILDMPDMFK